MTSFIAAGTRISSPAIRLVSPQLGKSELTAWNCPAESRLPCRGGTSSFGFWLLVSSTAALFTSAHQASKRAKQSSRRSKLHGQVRELNVRQNSCASVKDVAMHYEGFTLDQYGVMHDGNQALPGAVDCLKDLRNAGKKVVLVSNAPCEGPAALKRLSAMGFEEGLFDGIFTSGDLLKRHLLAIVSKRVESGKPKFRVAYIGRKDHANRGVWSPEDLKAMGFELASSAEEADMVLATGLDVCFQGTSSETEIGLATDSEDWGAARHLVETAVSKGLPLLCGNPDQKMVRADGTFVNCPGLLRNEYLRLGGKDAPLFGKPAAPIFIEAKERMKEFGATTLCHIGDSIFYDIGGAHAAGLPALFVRGGLHWKALQEGKEIQNLCQEFGVDLPRHEVDFLRW